jgi:uncharacterized protein YjiS (DUF1127 family)
MIGQIGFIDMSSVHSKFLTNDILQVLARAVPAARRMWSRYLERRVRLRGLAELYARDDMMLKDIGVTRSDVRAAIRSGADLRSVRE